MKIGGAGRLFFAIGLAGFGILQFIYGDFVPGAGIVWLIAGSLTREGGVLR